MNHRPTALLAVSLCAAACGASSPTTAAAPSPLASTVEAVIFAFAADFALMTTPGATAQVTAIGIWPNNTTQDVTSTCTNWQSDNASVLTVTSGGLLTAQSTHGSATITTTCQGVAARGLVTLNPPPSLQPSPPASAACPTPPYTWDANPKVLRCRAPNGQFAPSACCGH